MYLVNRDVPIEEAYSKMVSGRTRRVLAKYDYNNNGNAFRSARCAEEPKETDVSNEFFVFFCLTG